MSPAVRAPWPGMRLRGEGRPVEATMEGTRCISPSSPSRKQRSPRRQSLSRTRLPVKVGAHHSGLRGGLRALLACFSYFASLTESAGPSGMNTGKPEASSLDSREKKVGPAPRSTGGSHGARSGCSEDWALGHVTAFLAGTEKLRFILRPVWVVH